MCKKRPLKVTRNPTVLQKVQKVSSKDMSDRSNWQWNQLRVSKVPADHDLLTWQVPYAVSMHRRFAVGRDGKTAYERNVGRRAVPSLAQFGERVWWMLLQPSNRRLGLLDSRVEQGRHLGPMDGSNTVLVGTAREWWRPEQLNDCRQANDGLAACWTKHSAPNTKCTNN